jgi:hypothetical protein
MMGLGLYDLIPFLLENILILNFTAMITKSYNKLPSVNSLIICVVALLIMIAIQLVQH